LDARSNLDAPKAQEGILHASAGIPMRSKNPRKILNPPSQKSQDKTFISSEGAVHSLIKSMFLLNKEKNWTNAIPIIC